MPRFDRPLSNDALGKKGERHFGELCDDAELIANASDYDRSGWDYTVDFRYAASTKGLDERPSPPSARVQVKTRWSDSETIKVRLSAAEQIAKYTGPSFFAVLSVGPKLEYTELHLLHCRGLLLEKILKKLREAEAKGQKPNEVWIALRPSDFSEALEPTGSALRTALEDACGPSAPDYAAQKAIETNNLGRENGGIRLQVQVSGDEDTIAEGFLGLRPLSASNLNLTSTRFGVDLPIPDAPSGSGLIHFKPKGERCRLVFRTGKRIFKFSARSYRVPTIVGSSARTTKSRITTDTFSLTVTITQGIDGEGQVKFNFTMDETNPLTLRKPSEWDSLYGVFSALIGDGAEMVIKTKDGRNIRQFLKIENRDREKWQFISHLMEASAFVFDEANAPNSKLTLDDIWNAKSDILTLSAMVREPETVTGVDFSTDASVDLPKDSSFRMMLGNAFQAGSHILAYSAGLEVTGERNGDNWRWTSETVELMRIRKIRSEADLVALLDASPRRPYRVITGIWQAPRADTYEV